jgi:fructuronate reductase
MNLDRACVAHLPPTVRHPGFSPAELAPGIVHLGCGAFARAHAFWFTQRAIEVVPGPWGVVAVNLRGRTVPEALNAQERLYSVLTRRPEQLDVEIVGVIVEALYAPANPGLVVERLADPATRVVTLTVTEKGYCHVPATGDLDESHPDIRADLAKPDAPCSAIGFLVAGLSAVRVRRQAPPTIVSCDNLPSNGRVLAKLVTQFAALRDPGLATWIAEEVRFPSTMVDRIVPATTDDDRLALRTLLGYADRAVVVAEPFAQWVIEDRFLGARPSWDRVGVEIVPEVAPFERAKLRLLNGAHSALAYRGLAKGHITVAEAMADPELAAAIRALMSEAATTLDPVPGLDIAAYSAQICTRFANAGIQHRLSQIAMDGSQKLPQRLLGTIADTYAAGRTAPEAIKAVGAWIDYVRRSKSNLSDPLAEALGKLRTTEDFLSFEPVFGRELLRNASIRAALSAAVGGFDNF